VSRWHEQRNALRRSRLTPGDRLVYREILDCCDYRTGELDPERMPTVEQLAEWAGLSHRQVTYALKHLERHGWIVRGRTSRGYIAGVLVLTGEPCDCKGRRHVA